MDASHDPAWARKESHPDACGCGRHVSNKPPADFYQQEEGMRDLAHKFNSMMLGYKEH